MAEGRFQVLKVAPGGLGIAAGLDAVAKSGSLITAMEDQSLRTAKRILDPYSDEDSDFEFCPFSELIVRFAGMCGLATKRRANKSQLVALIREVTGSYEHDHIYADASRFIGTAELLATTITDLHRYGLMAADVAALAESATGYLKQKLQALADLEVAVSERMEERALEFGVERARQFSDVQIPEAFPIKHVVCIASHEPHPIYDFWLKWLTSAGVNLDLIIESQTTGFESANPRIEAWNPGTVKTLNDVPWTSTLFTEDTTTVNPQIQIIRTGSPLAEAEWALRHAYDLTKNGMAADSIGIFTRNADQYAPLIIASSRRLGVPIQFSINLPIFSNGFVRFIVTLLRALSNTDPRALKSVLDSSYLALEAAAKTKFMEIAVQARERGAQAWDWMEEQLENCELPMPDLLALIRWRKISAQENQGIRAWADRLRHLWDETFILARAAQSEITAQRDFQAQNVLFQSVSNTALELPPDTTFSFGEFLSHILVNWESQTYTWSQGSQGVRLCTNSHQLQGFDALLILDMVEGTMPRRAKESPILSDSDINFINESGKTLAPMPTSHSTARLERDEFSRICGSASSNLWFSCPGVVEDREAIPSMYLDELCRTTQQSIDEIQQTVEELAPLATQCKLNPDYLVRNSLDHDPIYPKEVRLSHPKAMEAARPNTENGLTPAELAAGISCPFRAVFSDRLGLRANFEFERLDRLRSVQTQVCPASVENINDLRAALTEGVRAKVAEFAPRLMEWELRLFEDGGKQLINQWVKNEREFRKIWELDNYSYRESEPELGGNMRGFVKAHDREINLKGKPAFRAGIGTDHYLFLNKTFDNTEEWRKNTFSESSWLELMTWMLVHQPKNTQNSLIFTLKSSGNYDAYLLPSSAIPGASSDHLDDNVKQNLLPNNYRSKKDQFAEIRRKYQDRAARSLSYLESGESRATPSIDCERCQIADLCRSHLTSGEIRSPFDLP